MCWNLYANYSNKLILSLWSAAAITKKMLVVPPKLSKFFPKAFCHIKMFHLQMPYCTSIFGGIECYIQVALILQELHSRHV